MSRGVKYSAGIVLAAFAMVIPHILLAQGELTLEGLAEQVGILFASREESDSRISALETLTAPTSAPTFTPHPTRTPRPTATRTSIPNPSAFRVSAQQVLDDYKDNRLAAQEKYEGIVFEIKGEVLRIDEDGGFVTAVHFKIRGGIFDAIQCVIAESERIRRMDLSRGLSVILRGRGKAKSPLGHIVIKECEIVDPASPAPAKPTSTRRPTPRPSLTFTPTVTASPTDAPEQSWQKALDESKAYEWVNQAREYLWDEKRVHSSKGGWMQWYSELNMVEVFMYIVDRCDLTGDDLAAIIWEYENDPIVAAMNRVNEPNLTNEVAIFRDLNRAAQFDTRPCTHLIDRFKEMYMKEQE